MGWHWETWANSWRAWWNICGRDPEGIYQNIEIKWNQFQGKKGKFVAYFIPDDEPDNLISVSFDQIPSVSTPNSASSTPGCSKTPSFSFKEVMLKRLDDVQNSHVRQQNLLENRKRLTLTDQ